MDASNTGNLNTLQLLVISTSIAYLAAYGDMLESGKDKEHAKEQAKDFLVSHISGIIDTMPDRLYQIIETNLQRPEVLEDIAVLLASFLSKQSVGVDLLEKYSKTVTKEMLN